MKYMKYYKVKVKWELFAPHVHPCTLSVEVRKWMRDNNMFGWYVDRIPDQQEYCIGFTNSTDAMLFTLRWS